MIIVDTNVVIYLLVESEYTESAIEIKRRDRKWVAPYLWRSEFRNVMMGYIRRGSLDVPKAIKLCELAERQVQTRHVDGSRVMELVFGSNCTAYDCEFVSLAEQLSIPLVTSDKKLLAAFPGMAVSMDEFVA